MDRTTIVIADDHPLLLKGLGDFLKFNRFEVVKACTDGSSAWKAIMDFKPDYAILDITMPYLSGIQVSELVYKKNLSTKVILISYAIESSIIQHGNRINISGYLLKEDALEEIVQCIDAIASGERYISAGLRAQLPDKGALRLELLTPTERKIILKIAEGLSSREVSEFYSVSERTVEKHRSNIISKLDLEGGSFALLSWVAENKEIILRI